MGLFSKEIATLNVIARAPFEVYYEGEANAVTATNKVGEFDVLPNHADFFSMLIPCTVTVHKDGEEPVSFAVNNGMVTVKNNDVMLFVNM